MPKILVWSNVFPRQRGRGDYAQLDAFTHADVCHIAWFRFGNLELPDNDEGGRFFKALLLKGMPTTQLIRLAPWSRSRPRDFFRIVDQADREQRKPDAKRLGELLDFTFDELKALKRNGISIKFVAPFDAQRWQVDEFWESEERNADRERKLRSRKQRKENTMPTLTKRATIIYKAVGTNWISVPAIMNVVASKMRNERNRMLVPAALRSAVKRGIDELVAQGLADTKIDFDEHGKATRFTRRSHVTGQKSDHVSNGHVSKNPSGYVATS